MRTYGIMLATGLLVGSCAPLDAQEGPTAESLRVTHETLVRATTSGNVARLESLVHPEAMGFFRDSQPLVQLRPGYGPGDVLPPILAELAGLNAISLETDYRVAGQVGVVCLTAALQDSRRRSQFVRATYAYAYGQDGWKLISWHASNVPVG